MSLNIGGFGSYLALLKTEYEYGIQVKKTVIYWCLSSEQKNNTTFLPLSLQAEGNKGVLFFYWRLRSQCMTVFSFLLCFLYLTNLKITLLMYKNKSI